MRLTVGVPLALTVDLAFSPLMVMSGQARHVGAVTRWVLDPTPLPVATLTTPDAPEPERTAPATLRVLRARDEAGEPVEAQIELSGRHLGGCPLPTKSSRARVVDGTVEATW